MSSAIIPSLLSGALRAIHGLNGKSVRETNADAAPATVDKYKQINQPLCLDMGRRFVRLTPTYKPGDLPDCDSMQRRADYGEGFKGLSARSCLLCDPF